MTQGNVRLELHEPHYDGPDVASLAEQKKALLENRFLHRRLRGTLRLVDTGTGETLDERRMTLMRVPVLTQRHTFIHNGNEYTTLNQARMEPGVYTRRKASGELESHFNAKRGTGPSHRVTLDPTTGVFKLNIGQASLRLYSLLKDIGVTDEQMEESWGPEVLAQNRKSYDPRVFEKAYQRLVRRKPAEATREQKIQAIRDALGATLLKRDVVERNLPNLFSRKLASEWMEKRAMTATELPEVPSDGLDHAGLVNLANYLNQTHGASIPLDLPMDQLVMMIQEFVDTQSPEFNEDLTLESLKSAAMSFDYGCLMATLEPHDAVPILDWVAEMVDPDKLDENGIEHETHVTVLYGFKPGFDKRRLARFLKDRGAVRFTLGKVSRFKGVSGGRCDCLKVDVDSQDLRDLRSAIEKEFGRDIDEPHDGTYRPHMTLAYVKPDTCKSLDGHARFEGQTYVIKNLIFSSPGSKTRSEIPLVAPAAD